MSKSSNRHIAAFTLVELILVIAVIGILAGISIVGFGRYQSDTRDARRSSSIISISEALEKYYDTNGEYPSCGALSATGSIVSQTTLKGINQSTLIAPQASSSDTNSIKCTSSGSVLTSRGVDFFEYQGDSSTTCNGSGSCLRFSLKYKDESSGTIKTISSRRNTNIATSGVMNLQTGSVTYTSAVVNWGAIQNATSYIVQRDTVSSFNSPNIVSTTVGQGNTSYNFTDLYPGLTQYYRAQVVASTGNSDWSNTISQTTPTLPSVTLANTQNTPSQVTESWNSASGSVNYTIQRAAAADFSGAVDTNTGTFTTTTYSDTPVAVDRSYRVKVNTTNSLGTTYSGAWNNLVYKTYVPSPTSPAVLASMSGTNAVGVSGTATCTQGATIQYAIRETHKANSSSSDNWSAFTAWSGTPPTLIVAGLQGNQHTFQVAAACLYGGVYSTIVYGPTASTIRAINTPPIPTWPAGLAKTWTNKTYGHAMWYGTYCQDGTWVQQTWFHSKAWLGASPQDYYHTFGFDDYWLLGPSGGANVEYWAMYTCISSYAAESSWSGQSYDVITVSP